jgi:hypothetical protein
MLVKQAIIRNEDSTVCDVQYSILLAIQSQDHYSTGVTNAPISVGLVYDSALHELLLQIMHYACYLMGVRDDTSPATPSIITLT